MSLSLTDYRALVALDTPFVVRPPAVAADRADLISGVLAHLANDGTAARLGFGPESADDDVEERRRRLRALLTVRGPAPLPEPVWAALDALLQYERGCHAETDAASLPRIPGRAAVALWQGDITTLAADAIVNAANAALLGCFQPFHACIDNAIHSAAGPRLREDCGRIMAAQGHAEPTGAAKATRAYNLPSRYVLHTVGPIVEGALRPVHEAALADCYRACLDVAAAIGGVRSVAFCAISTGVFGFPKAPAARIAVDTVDAWLRAHPGVLDLVVYNVFGDEDRAIYEAVLRTPAPEAR